MNRTSDTPKRIVPRYRQPVTVPDGLRKFLWDHPGGTAPLEKVVLRVFTYGKFEQVKDIYNRYPRECFDIIHRYPDIKRGVRFWIKEWFGAVD